MQFSPSQSPSWYFSCICKSSKRSDDVLVCDCDTSDNKPRLLHVVNVRIAGTNSSLVTLLDDGSDTNLVKADEVRANNFAGKV